MITIVFNLIGLWGKRVKARRVGLVVYLLVLLGLGGGHPAGAAVVFNEIMHHPATGDAGLEWVELHNPQTVDVDLSGWHLAGDIEYAFPSGSRVRGRGYAVVARAPEALAAATGLSGVHGPFLGQLGKSVGTLQLTNPDGHIIDAVGYGVEDDWPVAPGGSGVSLAKRDPDVASGPAANWTWSDQVGGTPGAGNFPDPEALPEVWYIAGGSVWKYHVSGTDPVGGWASLEFDDSGWASGEAWFFQGAVPPSEVRVIPTLFSTGVGEDGRVLAPGLADPHYVVTAAAQGPVHVPALVIQHHPAWVANDGASSWIGVQNPGTTSVNDGGYHFLTHFVLDGFVPDTVRIDLRLAVDDLCPEVLLNGVLTGIAITGFSSFSPSFSLLSGFVTGTNTIEFRTVNDGTSPNPAGFRAVLAGSGRADLGNTLLPSGGATTYFRQEFVVAGDPVHMALRLNAVVADGAVFYLNGTEVHRVNLPAGLIHPSTPALSRVPDPAPTGWVTLPTGRLVAGINVLAVELHAAEGDSGSLVFGASLAGRPGNPPPVHLAFNELGGATGTGFWVELVNHGDSSLTLDTCAIAHGGPAGLTQEYIFPPDTVLAPGAFLALPGATLGFAAAAGDRLFLRARATGRVLDAILVTERLRGRWPDGTGPFLFPEAPTPGEPNRFALRDEVVINEILYHPRLLVPADGGPAQPSPEAWLELYNRGTEPVDLSGWELEDGIRYRFAPGQVLAPGGYLVVAEDAAFLRSLHPGIEIVGDFSGRLSRRGERLLLRDAWGNPADEVHYFDGGRWPAYADGGGSSLELRDPRADNSKAEAWAASDETHQTRWQTVTYRAAVEPSLTPGPDAQWRDLVLGLLAAGECLIDDLRVVESPDDQPIELIANGSFENGQAGWRMLGNHGASRVIPDPDDPGNLVLRLVATGAQEHMHNHIETTLTANRVVSNGQTCEVSFRVRHLAGSHRLNTRLYFNRVARTTLLEAPDHAGTPGAPNTRFEPNIGPTFHGFQHRPVLPQPGEGVVVSIHAEDPQGVEACDLWWSVDGGPFDRVAMSTAGDGPYTGVLPGRAAGELVQFYVYAVDGLGTAATYPAAGPASGVFYRVADGQAILSLGHNLRILLSPSNTALLHASTNVMSNEPLPGTVILNERRAYYDVGVRLKGSQRGRDNPGRVSYHLTFPPDDLFRGVHPVMLIDRSPGGSRPPQEEILIKHMILHAGGIPGVHADLCRVIAPRPTETGSAMLLPRYEDRFLDVAFENGGDGSLFELELTYWPLTANAQGYKLPNPDSVQGVDIQDHGDDPERYRYNFLIKNHRDADDYRQLITFARSWSLSGDALESQTRLTMDPDQWMRVFALESLCGVADAYGFGLTHNLMLYVRPADGRMLAFPWDLDFSFYQSPTAGLLPGANLGRIVALPANQRAFYGHMLEMIESTYNPDNMAYWTEHYAGFLPGQDFAPALAYIGARGQFARDTIVSAGGNTPFGVSGPATVVTDSNLVTLTGTAPLRAWTIRANGAEYPVDWGSLTEWALRVPVGGASTLLTVQGYDRLGRPLPDLVQTVTVHHTGATASAADHLVINEIQYHAAIPGAEFVEIHNTSTTHAFDLSGYRLAGVDFDFAPGTIIESGGFVVVVAHGGSFAAAHGPHIPVVGQYPGRLQHGGERLRLIQPATLTEPARVVAEVTYGSEAPWPAAANGTGASLQLIDPHGTIDWAGNWAAVVPQPGQQPTHTSFIGMTDPWRYNQTESFTTDAWRSRRYDDRSWASGRALLYVSNNPDALPAPRNTLLTLGQTTGYFRAAFTNSLTNSSGLSLRLRTIIDDGAVFYLNGEEVLRLGMPAGPVTYSTFANRTVGNAALEGPFEIQAAGLLAGVNVLAVEVHQASLTSSDIVLGLELEAEFPGVPLATPGAVNSVRADLPPPTLDAGALRIGPDGAFWLEWDGEPGRRYRVQYKDDLEQAAWIDLVEVLASDERVAAVDLSAAMVVQRFYRVLRLSDRD